MSPGPGGRLGPLCDAARAAVIGCVLALVLLTYRDYGITWDETWHLVYGDFVLEWFRTFGDDRSALSYRLDFMYGGGFDLLGAVVRRLFPGDRYATIHLVGALVGVWGLAGAGRLARRLGGPVAGLLAVILLATTPEWWGQQFNNPKDLPFAATYVWALDALWVVVRSLPRPRTRDLVWFSFLAGLAMSVRIAGVLLLCYLVAAVGLFAIARARAAVDARTGFRVAWALGKRVLAVIGGAWVVMLATWPWAQLDPIRRPFMALGRMSRYTVHKRTMPFAGEDLLTTEPRPDYLLHYFGFKLPVVVLVLALVAVVLTYRGVRDRQRPIAVRLSFFVAALAVGFAPLYAVVARSVLYDGLRHVLFLVPVLVAGAAVAAVWLWRRYAGRWPVLVGGLALAGALQTGRVVQEMRVLHPHQYVYFNELIGGLHGAYGRYDTDYYGNSYKEGFAALADQLWQEDPEAYLETIHVVSGCIPDFIAEQYLPPSFQWRDKHRKRQGDAEFYLGYTRGNCHNRYPHRPVILRVQRQDTLLLVVRDLRRRSDEAQDADEEIEDAHPDVQ